MIVFMDGADQDMRTYKWNASTLTGWTSNNSNFTTGSYTIGTASSALDYEDVTGTGTVLAIGFWFNSNNSPTNFFLVGNSGFGQSASISYTVGGQLQFNKWGGGVIATTAASWVNQGWHWIDIYWDFHASNGTLKVYIDNVQQVNQTGISTLSAGTADVKRIGWRSNTSDTHYIDDVVWYNNTAGGLVYSDFPLGSVRIGTIRPNADATVTWTPSTGASNYALVDEQSLDTADYVETTVSTNQDLYDFASLGFTPVVIKSVQMTVMGLDPGGGGAQINLVCKSGGTTSVGSTTHSLLASTDNYAQEWLTDPNTSAAWTEAGINAAQFGQKMV